MSANRTAIKHSKRWVVKLGSSLLTQGDALAEQAIQAWAKQIAQLRAQGIEIVLVSSGAVAAGMGVLGLSVRPDALEELQAAAAIGQLGVANAWREALDAQSVKAAQILLTHEESANRERFLNARNTLRQLLKWGVVPVINENDTVATDEIRFGDNDRLAALAAELVSADVLLILTDQQGMYDADPRNNPGAKLIENAKADDPMLDQVAGAGAGRLGRGGMYTKLLAARMAAGNGIHTVIAGGAQDEVLLRVASGEPVGTCLSAAEAKRSARKRWLAVQQQVRGSLVLDKGACAALRRAQGRSLLPAGVLSVDGAFRRGDLVACFDEHGAEIARGLTNYSSEEAKEIAGFSSAQARERLGRPSEDELIHRDNLVLL